MAGTCDGNSEKKNFNKPAQEHPDALTLHIAGHAFIALVRSLTAGVCLGFQPNHSDPFQIGGLDSLTLQSSAHAIAPISPWPRQLLPQIFFFVFLTFFVYYTTAACCYARRESSILKQDNTLSTACLGLEGPLSPAVDITSTNTIMGRISHRG